MAIPLLKTQIEAIEKLIKDKREEAKKIKKIPQEQNTSLQLISPQKINEVLEDLLTTRYRLILLELKNLPPKAVALSQNNLRIFEHGIIIKFQGDYFSTMSYLQAIEKLGWRIFWDKLEYKVIQYPKAEITLQIHTISDQGVWIDV
jgi:MSHA biogenesis protein MshJ